jgi:hypothetical protein
MTCASRHHAPVGSAAGQSREENKYGCHRNCALAFFGSPGCKFFLIYGIVHPVFYGLLCLILRLEDYALPAGAILGFLTLAVVMFSILRVDWSGRENPARG